MYSFQFGIKNTITKLQNDVANSVIVNFRIHQSCDKGQGYSRSRLEWSAQWPTGHI